MTTHLRFIFFILVVGIVVNLTIIVLANASSRDRQARDTALEQQRFEEIIAHYDNTLCIVEIAVEWQRIGFKDEVYETSLLIRRRIDVDNGGPFDPHITRVIIPGSRVNIDGLMLDFNSRVPEDFKVLRNSILRYFCQVYGDAQPPEMRFRFIKQPRVPLATRIHPEAAVPTFFELRLWQFLWDFIPDPPAAATSPAATAPTVPLPGTIADRAAQNGIKVAWLKSDARAVRKGAVYIATLGLEGVTLQEDSTPGLYQSIASNALLYLHDDQTNPG